MGACVYLLVELVPDVSSKPLFEDEAVSGLISAGPLGELIATTMWDRGGAPLHFVLVHLANPDRALREASYANNAASVLIEMRWIRDVPNVRVLASCPDTDRCAAK